MNLKSNKEIKKEKAENIKKAKIKYLKDISNINITQIMKDSERGNLYRGVVSIEKLDGYIDTIRNLIDDAEETLK